MRKLAIYFSIIVVLFISGYLINQHTTQAKYAKYANNVYGISPENLNPESLKLLDDPNYQNIILPVELDQKIANKENFFLYYFGSTCPHCRATSPILMPLAKEMNVTLRQFNLDEFKDGWEHYKIRGTPTVIYYKAGIEVERLEGEQSKEAFKNFMAKYKQ
ncbi:hypothetical protein PAESOLCIP111_01596 [Paenibacillus solanacearum]|uniref:Thioredoxin n=1 Tax=Paenibacillus solanacearum TaxID=2048548 RepID=A0A916JZN9_9BACL|nr:thioredoxin family protein [Paenibacillus solanacearum]CAG7613377.1 hypothetical protein PAESOLCIP111_01596 [Paenibacillus solanacearum]